MNEHKLTELEMLVLANLFESSDGNGHDFGFVEEAGIDPRQARGVVSSLSKKGIIEIWDPVWNGQKHYTQFTWKKAAPHQINSLADVI